MELGGGLVGGRIVFVFFVNVAFSPKTSNASKNATF